MVKLLQEHRAYKLDDFLHVQKSQWPLSVQIAFSKRQYLHREIQSQADRLRGQGSYYDFKMPRAAEMLDQKRGDMTMDKFLKKLKHNDPKTKTRKRKRGNN